MKIRQAYEESLRREGHESDAAQLAVIERFEALESRLRATPGARGLRGLVGRLGRRERPAVRGLYIWGGVGRGKTFLMDLFFDGLGI
ncbi:MAG: AFG1/ZapE family ATPase, partial [Gammaproteobacteria bacterium]|nr:AFG1/ZapE family ATPase [Gammaproteobacteria bacterium]